MEGKRRETERERKKSAKGTKGEEEWEIERGRGMKGGEIER